MSTYFRLITHLVSRVTLLILFWLRECYRLSEIVKMSRREPCCGIK